MNWDPFVVVPLGTRPEPPRSIASSEGIGDRLRTAAFAELQARTAFEWGIETFPGAPEGLKRGWQELVVAEDRHLNWLLKRMSELGVEVSGRKVSDQLWHSLRSCKTAEQFALFMASAEERGQRAGEQFFEALRDRDPVSAEIFRKIAKEEAAHVALARAFFPNAGA